MKARSGKGAKGGVPVGVIGEEVAECEEGADVVGPVVVYLQASYVVELEGGELGHVLCDGP